MRHLTVFTQFVTFAVTVCSLSVLSAQEPKSAALIQEYCRRARDVPPRDADAHVDFAAWCASKGLNDEAQEYYRAAIAIDADHSAARAALGFVRHGSKWVAASKLPTRNARSSTGTTDDDDDATSATRPRRARPADRDDSSDAGSSSDAGTPEVSKVDLDDVDADLARKRAWAKEVAAKLGGALVTIEDDDFLIHTTLPSAKDARVRQLQRNLADSKKLIAGFIGARSSDPLWPAKEQFVLLRSEQQYEQFAELVDDVDYAKNKAGAYTANDHTVLWRPDTFHVCKRLSETALDGLHGSDRHISWWVSVGISERLESFLKSSRSTDEKEKQAYQRGYVRAADALKSEKEPANIYFLLESRELERNERKKGEALAMTLVDFLQRTRKSAFHSFLKMMKSDDAPPPPEEGDDEGLKTYWLNYFAFQEKSLKASYRKDTEKLDELWKKHVLREAARYNLAPEGTGRTTRGRNQGQR